MAWSRAVAEVFKFLNSLIGATSIKKQIEKVNNIYDAMHRAIAESIAQRFLIMRAHNGGGVIKPTGDLYASVLYQDYVKPFHDVKADYQKLPVDKEYTKMLLDIMQNKKLYYPVSEMPESLLKNIYKKEGVQHVFLYYLGQDRKNIYFCSIGTSKSLLTWRNTKDELLFDLIVNIIRQNIK